jgi:hypothetical protein
MILFIKVELHEGVFKEKKFSSDLMMVRMHLGILRMKSFLPGKAQISFFYLNPSLVNNF